jgi:hypothetical protein
MGHRNRAAAVWLTVEQRQMLDDAVLWTVRRLAPRARAQEVTDADLVMEVLAVLPSNKADYRYIQESLQRLRKVGIIEIVNGAWSSREEGCWKKSVSEPYCGVHGRMAGWPCRLEKH